MLSFMPNIPEISVGSQMVRYGPKRSTLIGRTGRTANSRSILSNRFVALPVFSSFHLHWEFGKEIKNSKSHSFWLAWFDRKMSFHSSWGSPDRDSL